MRCVEITSDMWRSLLSWRNKNPLRDKEKNSAAFSLYGPIAAGNGPFVLAQVGQSLDGRVATLNGDARDISGADGIAHLHRCRALVDAVLVGVGTIRADNPQLSVRAVEGPDPVRVVIDCRAELGGDEGLFHDKGAPVILIQSTDAPRKFYPAEVIRLREGENGLCPRQILEALAERNLLKILVEGGARTMSRFIDFGLVDRLHVSVAPLIIGSGPAGISLPPVHRLSDALRPPTHIYKLGEEVLFDCHLSEVGDLGSRRKREKIEVADLEMPPIAQGN